MPPPSPECWALRTRSLYFSVAVISSPVIHVLYLIAPCYPFLIFNVSFFPILFPLSYMTSKLSHCFPIHLSTHTLHLIQHFYLTTHLFLLDAYLLRFFFLHELYDLAMSVWQRGGLSTHWLGCLDCCFLLCHTQFFFLRSMIGCRYKVERRWPIYPLIWLFRFAASPLLLQH